MGFALTLLVLSLEVPTDFERCVVGMKRGRAHSRLPPQIVR